MEELNLKNYAHLGDAVWELFIREKTVFLTENTNELHKLTTDWVKAKFQHDMLLKLEGFFTDEEKDILRRARNLSVPVSRRSNQSEYRAATALEAIVGYFFLQDKKRLENLFQKISTFL